MFGKFSAGGIRAQIEREEAAEDALVAKALQMQVHTIGGGYRKSRAFYTLRYSPSKVCPWKAFEDDCCYRHLLKERYLVAELR
jgi:hypothetical protein